MPSAIIGIREDVKIIRPINSFLASDDKSRLLPLTLWLINNKLKAKTSPRLAIFDPNEFPIAILVLLLMLAMIEINISGEDVARPINIKLDVKWEILNLVENFSVESMSIFAPYVTNAKPAIK